MKGKGWSIFGAGFVTGALLILSVAMIVGAIGNLINPPPDSTVNLRSVILENNVANDLNTLYGRDDNEYFACLTGTVDSRTIMVSGIYDVEVSFANESYVIAIGESGNPCNRAGSLGSIHSHPRTGAYDDCDPSDTDIFTFGDMTNPEPIINAIQCGNDRFKFMAMPVGGGSFTGEGLDWVIQ